LLWLLSFSYAFAQPPMVNDQPIIGILTVGPTSDDCPTYLTMSGIGGCFTSFYVKWIEMAGGRVVPIPYNAPESELDFLFNSVNGILFTGGELALTTTSPYYKTAYYLYARTLAANDVQDYFPLWGTCMGFQMLTILTSQNISVLSLNAFDSQNLSIPLDYTSEAPKSRMFGTAPADVVNILGTEPVTTNLHTDGVKPDDFYGNTAFNTFYSVLSTNVDRQNLPFISTIEGRVVPVYGTQWHPERNQFEWSTGLNINHSPDAIHAMQYMADFFVDEARRNTHSFSNDTLENQWLIYNWNPIYMGSGGYQVYQFDTLPK